MYHLNCEVCMGLVDFPNPADWYNTAKNGGMERSEVNAFVSMAYSAQIAFLWRSGSSKWAQWTGEGKALQDMATAIYLTLSSLEAKNFLTLTVPADMLTPDNLSKFQTEKVTK
jgi:hypothetical protein